MFLAGVDPGWRRFLVSFVGWRVFHGWMACPLPCSLNGCFQIPCVCAGLWVGFKVVSVFSLIVFSVLLLHVLCNLRVFSVEFRLVEIIMYLHESLRVEP
jgi:hypothetical protein